MAVSRHNKNLDKTSETYEEDKLYLNVKTKIAEEFDLYGEFPKQKEIEEQVLFDAN